MNTKRWIAIVVAVALFFLPMLFPSSKQELSVDDLLPAEKVNEEILEAGKGNGKIVYLEIDGTIADDSSNSLFSEVAYNHNFFMEQLKKIEDDPQVKGVLLSINSPGGGVYESSEIAKELKKIQKIYKIPVYVTMKSMAASGGYYVSAGADKIYATEETMTGSIGVIMSGLNVTGLMEKIGVSDETVKSGDLKDMGSMTRKWSDEDREVYQTMIDNSYNRFVKVVSVGRKMSTKKVKEIADGRVYDGAQAKENGLVDAIGFPEDALEGLRVDKGLQNMSVIRYTMEKDSLFKRFPNSLFDSVGQSKKAKKESDTQIISSLIKQFGSEESPRMMYLYGGE